MHEIESIPRSLNNTGKLTELHKRLKPIPVNEDSFPTEAFEFLNANKLFGLNIPKVYGGMGIGVQDGAVKLLTVLKEVGFYDLSVGRIYEGHLNAMQLIEEFGTPLQKVRYFKESLGGMLFGVWNSEFSNEGLQLMEASGGSKLKGAKVFCSGGVRVKRPIVTVATTEGKRMIVLNLDQMSLKEDHSFWTPLGMKASMSCRLDFSEMRIVKSQFLGELGDYEREPLFSGGAIRFAAVQLGGAEAAIYHTLEHLKKLDRTGNVHQTSRLGRLAILRERGNAWVQRAGKAMGNQNLDSSQLVNLANMMRIEVREICEEVLSTAELSVGLAGLMTPHPLERIHRDLSVYLKQPGPDRALEQVGKHIASHG
ncbi:acyl-CoA dehydrogenase family protein [Zobellia galactanivorans]|uniref:acyl-CoA dehydrogenase family protein n=1 Tax=Zobellia galactanivorans (strain DSM 12802 / CCUG 47099 / CIP 106680 / NCIMB 13871 / Dsij) TaxID=63186 RepID=UPI001C07CC01|nr:acyl-CoA dehydrogenase family protein [Zobellia galactanivorans]MBU3025217.1 acyl-CoA/acyl-ACP dehydrogenase [Zobellia galactanivorans]MDO6810945.1 acyl-CoA dehydrogenase family protein [Zobellia galactanivorans]